MIAETDRMQDWIGRTEDVIDDLSPWQARAVAAMLDDPGLAPERNGALPPLWHWFYFLACVAQSRLAGDGHPERGDFLPPVELPRRMFAGGRMTFHRPLRVGHTAERHGVIRDVATKVGRTGKLTFVTVGYEFRQDGELCIEEEQDIVYREAGKPLAATSPVAFKPLADNTWSRELQADSRLLFRFSALTFNAHRIHYDAGYAHDEEGYPGLIVHGPLTAVLLADLVRRETDRRIAAFSFRSRAPLFDLHRFRLIGKPGGDRVALEVEAADGRTTQTADVVLA